MLTAPPVTVPVVVFSSPDASTNALETVAPICMLPAKAAVLVIRIEAKTVIIIFFS